MSSRLNVLSIDWDYFIKVSGEQRCSMFPDGGNENFSLSLQPIIWSGYYKDGELPGIKTDTQAIRKVKKKIYRTGGWEPLMCQVRESHRHCYKFIKDSLENYGYDSLNVVNIDFHHDIYQNGVDVDCGNWFRKIIDEYKDTDSIFTWIKREDSDDFCDEAYKVDEVAKRLNTTESMDILFEYDWDIIYVCKSGMWSPPHLDRNFKAAFGDMLNYFATSYETQVFKDRYPATKKFLESQILAFEKAFYAERMGDDKKL